MTGREAETEEGIDKKPAVFCHAKWKFLYDLLPALKEVKEAGEKGAVISILAAGKDRFGGFGVEKEILDAEGSTFH